MVLRWTGLSHLVLVVLGREVPDVGEGVPYGSGQELPDYGRISQCRLDLMSRR